MEQAMNPLLSAWTRYLQRRAGGRRPSGPSAKDKRKSVRRTPRLERLEDRAVPAAYLVNTTADGGAGSLRDAITQVNAGLYNEIDFSLPWNDPGHVYYQGSVGNVQPVPAASASDADLTGAAPQWPHSWWSIQPANPLPAITNPVLIDGYTQPGASGNTNPFGQADNAVLKVELTDCCPEGHRIDAKTTPACPRAAACMRMAPPRAEMGTVNFSSSCRIVGPLAS
jgi:hypothetical protein